MTILTKRLPSFFRVYHKLTLIFCLAFLLNLTLSIFMVNSGSDVLTEQTVQLSRQKLLTMVGLFDSQMANIMSEQIKFNLNQDLYYLSSRDDFTNYDSIVKMDSVVKELTLYNSSYRYLDEALIYLPKQEWLISSDSSLLSTLNETNDFFLFLADFMGRSAPGSTSLPLQFIVFKSKLYSVSGYPIGSTPKFISVAAISLANIQKDLDIFSSSHDGFIYIEDLKNGLLITPPSITGDDQKFIDENRSNHDTTIRFNGGTYIHLKEASTVSGWEFNATINRNNLLKPSTIFKKWFLVSLATSFLLVAVVLFMLFRIVHAPFQKLINAFKSVEIGRLKTTVNHNKNDEFRYLYTQFNMMTEQLDIVVNQLYKQKIHSQQAELKHLQSQINPHFLYNSLYLLYRMAQNEDYTGVSSLARHLGDYFKFLTRNQSDTVTLRAEINHAQTYSYIQQARFRNRIAIGFQVRGDIEQWEVPRIIIQPLIENAIHYGLENVYQGGKVDVSVVAGERKVIIAVTDNGQGMDPERLKEVNRNLYLHESDWSEHAIHNIHRRLQLRYGSASGIQLIPNQPAGLTVTIAIEKEEFPLG